MDGPTIRFMQWILSQDPALLAAWATVISALSSVALLIATVWLGLLTRVLARETLLAREAGERAEIQCALQETRESISFQQLVVANVGKAAARDVVVKIERGGHFHSDPHPTFPFSVILPSRDRNIFVGSYMQMEDKVFKARIIYSDKFGRHETAYEQDLSLWDDLVQLGDDPSVALAREAKKMREAMEGWSRHRRLRVETFGPEERAQEQAAVDQMMLEHMEKRAQEQAAKQAEAPPPAAPLS